MGLGAPPPLSPTPPPTHRRNVTVCSTCPVVSSHLRSFSRSRFPWVDQAPGPARSPLPSERLLLRRICALSCPPTSRVPQCQERGGGCGRLLPAHSEPALARRGEVLPTSRLRGSRCGPGVDGASGRIYPCFSLASFSGSREMSGLGLEAQVPQLQCRRSLFPSPFCARNRCRVGDCVCFYDPRGSSELARLPPGLGG